MIFEGESNSLSKLVIFNQNMAANNVLIGLPRLKNKNKLGG